MISLLISKVFSDQAVYFIWNRVLSLVEAFNYLVPSAVLMLWIDLMRIERLSGGQ